MERTGRRDVVSKTATNSHVRVKEATASSPDLLTWKYTHYNNNNNNLVQAEFKLSSS